MTAPAPKRPVLRWHGGKWRLAPWIIAHLPPHRIYVEPFGGAGSVLMRKPRSFFEVYNDLDANVVNVFRVLRDPAHAAELDRLLRLTPWARREFKDSYLPTDDPIERARRTIVRQMMGFGTTAQRASSTGFRAKAWRRNNTGAGDFATWPDSVPVFVERLRGVTIEERPALEVIAQQDGPDTCFYVDPPYPWSTRTSIGKRGKYERAYKHEMADDDHRNLASVLHGVVGKVVLSGYPCDLYDLELYPDWKRVTRAATADHGVARTEVIWLNPAAATGRADQLHLEEVRR